MANTAGAGVMLAGATIVDGPLNWFAVRTRSRYEKLVALQLGSRQLEVFLPLYERQSRWQDRTQTILSPLFPGYLFVRIGWEQRNQVVTLTGVVNLVGPGRTPQPVPPEQLESVRRILEAKARVAPHPYLSEGDPCEIISGPLRGITGILLRRKKECRLVLSVDLLQRSAAVEVGLHEVVRLSKRMGAGEPRFAAVSGV